MSGFDDRAKGARELLLRLKDSGISFSFNVDLCPKKDEKVYSDAMFNALLGDKNAMVSYLAGEEFVFSEHERDKKGKLFKCKYVKNGSN